jgi:pimeloyl-ACP methyl ester carboxylesterase
MEAPWSEAAGPPDAPVAVLVHGSMDRSAGLLRLGRRLDGRFRVIRYDRRGYGRSVGMAPRFDMATQVEDLRVVLDRHAPHRPAALLFGHSYGGNVILAFAEGNPARVGAAVVYETPLSWLDWWPGNSAGGSALTVDDPGDAAEAFMRRLVGDRAWERLPASKREERRAEGPAMLGELADLRRRAPWRAERLSAPVLALHGELARPHHRRAMRHLADLVPDGRVGQVAGAGHAGPHTHADSVAADVTGFVESLSPGPRPASRRASRSASRPAQEEAGQ